MYIYQFISEFYSFICYESFLFIYFISFLYIEEEHLTTLKSRRQFVRILSRHQDISHSKY